MYIRQRLVLTVDAITGGVAAGLVKKSVSVSDASRPKELFAFVMDGIIVIPQKLATAATYSMFKVASLGHCEDKTSSLLVITVVRVY